MLCLAYMPVAELLLNKTKVEFNKILSCEGEDQEDSFSPDEYNPDPSVACKNVQSDLLLQVYYVFPPLQWFTIKNWYQNTQFTFIPVFSKIWQPPRLC